MRQTNYFSLALLGKKKSIFINFNNAVKLKLKLESSQVDSIILNFSEKIYSLNKCPNISMLRDILSYNSMGSIQRGESILYSTVILRNVAEGRRRQWYPTPVPLPGKSHGWRSLVGYSPWGREESDTTERLHFHFSLSCTGEGNGSAL